MGKFSAFSVHFKGREYTDIASVLRHAEEISRVIKSRSVKKVQAQRPLSELALKVQKVAPTFLRFGQYDRRAIITAVSTPENLVTPTRLSNVLRVLKKRGLIPSTTVSKLPRLTKFRTATQRDIEANIGLVHAVLKRGHPFLPSNWRQHLSYNNALNIGRMALAYAIETHNPTRGALSTHACNLIAGHVSSALRTHFTRQPREQSMDEPHRGSSGRTLRDVIGVASPKPELFENDLSKLLYHQIYPHRIMIWVLTKMYGHTLSELAAHFGVSRTLIHYHNSITRHILNEINR